MRTLRNKYSETRVIQIGNQLFSQLLQRGKLKVTARIREVDDPDKYLPYNPIKLRNPVISSIC